MTKRNAARSLLAALLMAATGVGTALAQSSGTPAKELFGAAAAPAPFAPRAIGFYSKGCLAGGVALPADGPPARQARPTATGPLWQAMRPSRNRAWGHPDLIAFLERFATDVPRVSRWPGLLVGDMSQPRGGPMRTGHASHQVGLDADIWLTPSPGLVLSRDEREKLSATMLVRPDRLDVDQKVWTPDHLQVIRAAARDPRVERIFVNAAIKKALCRQADGDRAWLSKVRPYWGHDYHMHVRLFCPEDSPDCRPQEPPANDDGCGSDLAWWFTDEVLHPKPSPKPEKPRPPLILADLPAACAAVLDAR